MRLVLRFTDFKTRLFIFFAGRLLKWAASIERELGYEQSPPQIAVDDSSATLFAESARESGAASGPPEHWTQLLTKGPPQHWLDLVRKNAPQLLSPLDDVVSRPLSESSAEPVSAENSQKTNDQPPGATSSLEEMPRSQQGTVRRSETKYASGNVNKKTWLNRLRFQEMSLARDTKESVDESDKAAREFDSATAAGGATEVESKRVNQLTLSKGTRRNRSQESTAYTTADPGKMRASSEHFGNPEDERPDDNPRMQHPPHSQRDALPQRRSEAQRRHTVSNRYPRHAEDDVRWVHASSSDVDRGDRIIESSNEAVTSVRRQTKNDPEVRFVQRPEIKSTALLKTSDMGRDSHFSEREATDTAAGPPQPRVKIRAAEVSPPSLARKEIAKLLQRRESSDGGAAAAHANRLTLATSDDAVRNQPSFFRRRETHVSGDEQARHEFASVNLSVARPHESPIESSANVWPTLPPMPKTEIADELAANAQDAEVLRRLDQEQQGTLWNA